MSEWIGWVGRLRSAIYSRMEDMSFRTGAATVAGVIAVAVTAILLTLTQGGHHAAPRPAQAGVAASRFLTGPTTARESPSAHRSTRRRPTAAPNAQYVPDPTKTPTARPQPSPSTGYPRPRHTWTYPPRAGSSPGTPGYPWPWPTPSFNWGHR